MKNYDIVHNKMFVFGNKKPKHYKQAVKTQHTNTSI